MKFFVAGITGNVGGQAARQLLDAGHSVVSLVRDVEKAAALLDKGAQISKGDLRDVDSVQTALKDVDGAFILVPPTPVPEQGFPESAAVIASYKAALKMHTPTKLVALSSLGSQRDSGLGNITATHMLEAAFADYEGALAFVRAGSLLENYLPGLGNVAATGILYSFLQPLDRKVGMVGTVDVGSEVAKLLTSTWTGRRILEVGTKYSPNEIAAAMQEALGRDVQAQVVPRDYWKPTFEQFGVPQGKTWGIEEIFDSLNSGWIDFGEPDSESVPAQTSAAHVFEAARQG